MDINHIGVVRLHELSTTNAALDCEERFHLLLCATCMQAFSAFFRKIEEDEKDLRGPAQSGTEQVQQACRAQFELLRYEITRVATLMGNDGELQTEKARVAQSRQLLAQTGAGL